MIHKKDLIGATGTVELPFEKGSKGKVIVRTKGVRIEYTAQTDEESPLLRDEEVIVIGITGNVVRVIRSDRLLEG